VTLEDWQKFSTPIMVDAERRGSSTAIPAPYLRAVKGRSSDELASSLGHTTLRMTQRYMHLSTAIDSAESGNCA
jgi:hypothetical protein